MQSSTKKHHIRYIRVLAVVLALAVLIGIITFAGSRISTQEGSDEQSSSIIQVSSTQTAESEPQKDPVGSLGDLRDSINSKLAEYPGTWSVYLKNMNTGDSFLINDKQFYPASVIKLFALGACYQQIEQGLIKEDDYYTYIYGMTVMSNNKAFNHMLWAMGRDYLTKWCHENGYTRTSQYHGLEPSDNAAGLTTSDKPNETCASDVGHMLESIYKGECVSKQASEKMLKMLKEQNFRTKIPYGIPYGPQVANKTGDTDDVSHDAAIVYSEGADYILVIMSENPGVASKQDHRFIELSSMVYKYFNK